MTQLSIAVVVAAVILGAAFLISHRYTIVASTPAASAVWRIDQLTGEMLLCATGGDALVCVQPRPNSIKSN